MSRHILLVEDDEDVRESLCEALEFEGYAVVPVGDGAAALRHLDSGARPCLILLDLMMPIMDGPTFRAAMLRNAALATIPVVLITAAGARAAATVPADHVLHKPLKMDVVVDLVQHHCPGGPPGARSGPA